MKKQILLIVLACTLILNFSSCCEDKKDNRKFNLPVKELTIQTKDGKTVCVHAEIASKKEERNWGFMERKNIPDGTGMLFVFEYDQQLSFWMHNTPTALSIAYITADGTIADILDMTPYSEASVKSSRSVRYALEVPQGWYKKTGISTGDKLKLPY